MKSSVKLNLWFGPYNDIHNIDNYEETFVVIPTIDVSK